MIEIIKRQEGFKSQREALYGDRAQISYNSDGHLCIRLLHNDNPEVDTLVVLDAQASTAVFGFMQKMQNRMGSSVPF